MSEVPEEFRPEHIAARSPLQEQLYTAQLRTPYPRRSFEEQGFVFKPSPTGDENGVDLEDGTLYYNTMTDEKLAYWAEHVRTALLPPQLIFSYENRH